jgi:hypothetical protein
MNSRTASSTFTRRDNVVFFGLTLIRKTDFAFHGVFFRIEAEFALRIGFYNFYGFDRVIIGNDASLVYFFSHFDESIFFDKLALRVFRSIFDSHKDDRVEVFRVE